MKRGKEEKSLVKGGNVMEKQLIDYEDVLTVTDVKNILKIGTNRAYDLVRAGTIKSLRIGNQYRIPKKCMIDYLESCYNNDMKPAI